MKKTLTEKTALRSRPLILAFIVLLSLPAFQALAPSLARAEGGDPFQVAGTDRVLIPQDQIEALQRSADTSKARLERLQRESEGMTAEGKNEKFKAAINEVVIASFQDKQGSETLMRTVLVQAMDLTYGIPNADGVGVRRRGVLDSVSGNEFPGVKMAIMEDSVQLALDFYMDDRRAMQEGSLGDLPFNRLARDRLVKARDRWLPMINDQWDVAYDLSYALMFQWLGTAKTERNLSQQDTAEEITQVNLLLKGLPANGAHPSSEIELERQVRKMRKTIHWLVDRLNSQKM